MATTNPNYCRFFTAPFGITRADRLRLGLEVLTRARWDFRDRDASEDITWKIRDLTRRIEALDAGSHIS